MIYYIITVTDILTGSAAIISLINVARNYHTLRRIEVYWFLTIAAMVFMIAVNAYNLTEPPRDWKLPIVSLLWAGKTLYYSWSIRFSSLKKK